MQGLGIQILFKGRNFLRLLEGLGITIRISLLSAAFSIPLGIGLGMLMTRKNPLVRFLCRLYLESDDTEHLCLGFVHDLWLFNAI